MGRQHPVFRAGSAHADHLQRAHVGGQKCQARDPERKRVARGEEVRARADALAQEPSDAYDECEIGNENCVVKQGESKRHTKPPKKLYPTANSGRNGTPGMKIVFAPRSEWVASAKRLSSRAGPCQAAEPAGQHPTGLTLSGSSTVRAAAHSGERRAANRHERERVTPQPDRSVRRATLPEWKR